jgi:hypothetical protein
MTTCRPRFLPLERSIADTGGRTGSSLPCLQAEWLGVTAADLRSRVSDSTRAGDRQCKDIGCAEAAKARGKRLGPEAMRGPTACDCCQERERRPVLREPFASDPRYSKQRHQIAAGSGTAISGARYSDGSRWRIDDYERFARSFTQIRAPDIRSQVGAIYASNRFWPEPLIRSIRIPSAAPRSPISLPRARFTLTQRIADCCARRMRRPRRPA